MSVAAAPIANASDAALPAQPRPGHCDPVEDDRRFFSAQRLLRELGERGNPDLRRELALIRPVSIQADMLKILDVFREHKGESFFPVLDMEHRPLGLLREEQLKDYVYSKYGQALLSHPEKRNDVGRFLSPCPAVDIATSTDELLEVAFGAESEGVIITTGGLYLGFIRLTAVVKLAHQRQLRLIEEHNQVLKQKNNDIQNMLNNMRQGIFTVLPDLAIHPEHSAHLRHIFETETIAGRNALALLLDGASLGADARAQVEAALGAVLGEEALMYEMNHHLLPGEYEYRFADGRRKVLELHWNPILDENDVVEKLMVVVRDVTELRGLQAEAGRRRRELEVLSQILAVSEGKFLDFLTGSQAFLAKNQALIEAGAEPAAETLATLFRNMHTIKGNARTLGFAALTDCVHQAEQSYELIRRGELAFDAQRLRSELELVRRALAEYEATYQDKLKGFGGERREGVFLDHDLVAALRESLDATAVSAGSQRLATLLRALDTVPLRETLADPIDGLPSLAEELGKPAPAVRVSDGGVRVRAELAPLLKDVFTHVLRNSLDHGLESPVERQALGKPPMGRIDIKAAVSAQTLTLEIADDGRGLDLATIRSKAVAAGLLAEQAGDEALAELIFHSGLSTAAQVSTVSGRGVGMDAVRRFLDKHQGKIRVEFRGPRGGAHRPFVLVITLPGRLAVRLS